MSSSKAFFKSVLHKDFGKFVKDRNLKIDINVVLFEEQDGSPKVIRSVKISGTDVTVPEDSHRPPHGGDLTRWSGSDLIFINAEVIQNDSFPIPCRYELHCTSMYDVP